MSDPEPTVPLHLLSRALDEIYALRQVCAHEAVVREVDLEFKSFPKARRKIAEMRIDRLKEAASGRWREAFDPNRGKAALRILGIPETLTRHAWEQEKP